MMKAVQKQLLQLARQTLENELLGTKHNLEQLNSSELAIKRGAFVTLTIRGELRGCIGHIQAVENLFQDMIDLAKLSAFKDHRFSPLTAKELPLVKIEISLLTVPVEVKGKSIRDKVDQIKPFVDGVILSHQTSTATFLPQVWESLPEKRDFLTQLCKKAGLAGSAWQKENLTIKVYQVEHFEES